MVDPVLEQSMLEALRPSELGSQVIMDQGRLEHVLTSVRTIVDQAAEKGMSPVLVCAPALRPAIRRLVAPQIPALAVLSYQEVTSAQVGIEPIGGVRAFDSIPA